MSWLEIEKKLLEIDKKHVKEPMKTINCYFLYVNQNDYIEKIDTEVVDILSFNSRSSLENENKKGFISQENVVELINRKSNLFNKKYKLKETSIYNVDLEPDNVFFYSQDVDFNEYSKRFFKVLSNGEKIVIHPSIFVFHQMNSIYFLLYEDIENIDPISPRSILKKSISNLVGDNGEPMRKKRVTIRVKNKNSKTRKSI
jgi:hypothetical protein